MAFNRKMGISDGYGGWLLRIFHRKKYKKRSARYLVKCGCCDKAVEIYYDKYGLEINGVHGSKEEWRKILEPLLSDSQDSSLSNST
ncbi:hypothetical protein [Candidatus Albibeggiatoa sp. nov. NOAA]|uniref:hypothetical protein n=1 Tax=Candidatus Albibeggiatoa sp. nov. NOAA TaxID=3162724 RepID=UPI003302EEE6|nr:hypothetical protein [Thiotrichaceae bacterium]